MKPCLTPALLRGQAVTPTTWPLTSNRCRNPLAQPLNDSDLWLTLLPPLVIPEVSSHLVALFTLKARPLRMQAGRASCYPFIRFHSCISNLQLLFICTVYALQRKTQIKLLDGQLFVSPSGNGRLLRTEPAELSCRRCPMLSTPESKKPIAKDGLGSIWAIGRWKTVLKFPAPQSDHSTRNTTTMPHKKSPTRIGKRGF